MAWYSGNDFFILPTTSERHAYHGFFTLVMTRVWKVVLSAVGCTTWVWLGLVSVAQATACKAKTVMAMLVKRFILFFFPLDRQSRKCYKSIFEMMIECSQIAMPQTKCFKVKAHKSKPRPF
jgi:hypothetical protein